MPQDHGHTRYDAMGYFNVRSKLTVKPAESLARVSNNTKHKKTKEKKTKSNPLNRKTGSGT